MPEITVASTTDSQEAINAAAGVIDDQKKESTEGDEPETKPASEAAEKDERHESKSAVQKRIDKLTREKYAARDELEGLKKRLLAIEQGGKPQVTPETKDDAKVSAKPTVDQFPDYDSFVEALAEWKAEEKIRKIETEKEEKATKGKQEQATQAIFDKYNERIEEAKERYDDFEDVVGRSALIPNEVAMAVIEMENGPDVAYYLGKHPEVCKKMMNSSVLTAIAEAGKISHALLPVEESTEDEKPVPKIPTRAKEPIRPVSGSSTKSSVPLDELPYSEFRKIREKQVKEQYRR